MFFADLLADGDHDALPADHGSRPRAKATTTLTHTGMNLVTLSIFCRRISLYPSRRWRAVSACFSLLERFRDQVQVATQRSALLPIEDRKVRFAVETAGDIATLDRESGKRAASDHTARFR